MLEKTEKAIKYGESRDTDIIRHIRHTTKTTKHKTQHRKLQRLATPIPPTQWRYKWGHGFEHLNQTEITAKHLGFACMCSTL
jgi:hypothetical protein